MKPNTCELARTNLYVTSRISEKLTYIENHVHQISDYINMLRNDSFGTKNDIMTIIKKNVCNISRILKKHIILGVVRNEKYIISSDYNFLGMASFIDQCNEFIDTDDLSENVIRNMLNTLNINLQGKEDTMCFIENYNFEIMQDYEQIFRLINRVKSDIEYYLYECDTDF